MCDTTFQLIKHISNSLYYMVALCPGCSLLFIFLPGESYQQELHPTSNYVKFQEVKEIITRYWAESIGEGGFAKVFKGIFKSAPVAVKCPKRVRV